MRCVSHYARCTCCATSLTWLQKTLNSGSETFFHSDRLLFRAGELILSLPFNFGSDNANTEPFGYMLFMFMDMNDLECASSASIKHLVSEDALTGSCHSSGIFGKSPQ